MVQSQLEQIQPLVNSEGNLLKAPRDRTRYRQTKKKTNLRKTMRFPSVINLNQREKVFHILGVNVGCYYSKNTRGMTNPFITQKDRIWDFEIEADRVNKPRNTPLIVVNNEIGMYQIIHFTVPSNVRTNVSDIV